MDEFEISYSLDDESQFWRELEDIVSAKCSSHQLIDSALRSYLHFTTNFKDEYLNSERDIAQCSQRLLLSELFEANKDYVRIQMVYSLLQEDEGSTLHIIASCLLLDGQHNETTFEMMNREGCFPKLLEWIKQGEKDNAQLHRLLLELLYEMSRMQRLSIEDLGQVDDELIASLFQIIEQLSDDVDDPYHYPVIRVLVSIPSPDSNLSINDMQLVLNEQYMVASTASPTTAEPPVQPLTNRVIKLLSLHGSGYMTFGENIILLLNRETETSLQLLILKLLYLIFTTKATYDYFYTNDLRVLLDVIIRNLLDLPNELISLRHTYLRVLYPLLAHTPLSQEPHYKRDEIIKVLSILGGSASRHWEPADETTLRLVERVAQVPWLRDDDIAEEEVAQKLLGISLSPSQAASSISFVDVAAVMEKPGVQTRSRKSEIDGALNDKNGRQIEAQMEGEVQISGRRHAPPPIPPMVLVNGQRLRGNGKKLPPKTPPRRRTKLKPTAVPENSEGTATE